MGLKELIKNWNETENLERWKDFLETMQKNGFIMDCYESYVQLFDNKLGEEKEERQAVIKNLKTADRQIVGNFIFSHWRYLTHWSYGYDEKKEREYFKELFEILCGDLG